MALGPPSDDELRALLAELHGSELTYPDPGRTLSGLPLPAGYHHTGATGDLGRGGAAWDAAREGLRGWQAHRGAGLRVVPARPPVAVGTEVVTDVAAAGPVHVLAACRIVAVVDEADRFGFAYGTLRVHPARGEEAFVVERGPGGAVRMVVTAFSRPNGLLMRLGGPVVRRRQAAAARAYVEALRRHVAG
ncbi:MAG TPA: DUF1990 domain-containing protein [Acidimicrobiales bacterium]|nr:DUF1990 domain-containing protein [Acidimicrobiales bacterium]